jgi:hypothetical protein
MYEPNKFENIGLMKLVDIRKASWTANQVGQQITGMSKLGITLIH